MSNKLDSKVKRLLLSHGIFLFGRSAFDIFLSVYIWRITNSVSTVALFNIIYTTTHTLIFVIFAESFRKGKFNLIKKIGLLGFSAIYILIAFLNTDFINYTYLFAFLIGIFNGMYWLPYHINRFDLTHIKNRGNYYGMEKSITTLVKLIAPALGGFIISSNYYFSGYTGLFLASTVFFLISLYIGNVKIDTRVIPTKPWFYSVKQILNHPKILKIFTAEMFHGFSLNGSLVRIILPLLILQKAGTEFKLGGWLSFFAILSIIMSAFFGKKLHYKKYDIISIIGGVIFILSFSLLYFYPTLIAYIIFGAAKEISAIFLLLPRRVYSENLLHKIKNYQENRIGYLVTREIFNIGFGTVGSFVFLLFAGDITIRSLSLYSATIIGAVLLQVYLVVSVNYSKEKFNSDFS